MLKGLAAWPLYRWSSSYRSYRYARVEDVIDTCVCFCVCFNVVLDADRDWSRYSVLYHLPRWTQRAGIGRRTSAALLCYRFMA